MFVNLILYMIKIYILIVLLINNCLAQDYNPCKDRRFISLTKIELDDMSDRQYNYFLKKEEECSKFRARKSRSRVKSINRIKSKNNKKDKKYIESDKTNNYTASVYSSLPLFRLNMVAGYNKSSINGFKLETPISFEIGGSVAYLKFEFRSYNFSDSNLDDLDLGGNAFLAGISLPIKFFESKNSWFLPEFSIATGKFHFSKGLLIGFDIPQKLSSASAFNVKYSLTTNIVESGPKNGTGWLDFSINIGYSFQNLIKDKFF